jgi:NAD(P)-dependent dehydrogenase (short-subunit alcohol dehydrogenase family)
MGTYVITGSASGIGRATRLRLEADGHHVVGVDLRDAEILADLSTEDGREAVAALDLELSGVVACAGVLGGRDNGPLVVSTNHFGAVATLEALQELIVEGGAAVVVGSNSATTSPVFAPEVLAACDADDEDAARRAATPDPMAAYAASKLALARWMRREAAGWMADGIRLNGVAPGLIDTPMTVDLIGLLPQMATVFPLPAGRAGRPEEVANAITWLLSDEASFCVGTLLTCDGGSEAVLRGQDWPSPR